MKYPNFTLLFVALFGFLILAESCGKGKDASQDSSKEKGGSVIETGELVAVNSQTITLPRYGRRWWEMRIIGILDQGSIVKAGDSIIQLDPTEVKKFIIEMESRLETEIASMEKLKVNNDNKMNDMEAGIKNASASFNLKKLEMEATRFESERSQRIKQLEFKQAQLSFDKEKKKMELSKTILSNDVNIQEIRIQQIERDIEQAYDALNRLTIKAPSSGVFQIGLNQRTGSLLKIGDNVYVGAMLANIPELSWMKVNTVVNENDFMKLKVGQPVVIRLDAMPSFKINGEITFIGKLCRRKDHDSRQKVFDVEVKILESDERLKPGMTVSCEFLTN